MKYEFEFTGVFCLNPTDFEAMVEMAKDGYDPEEAFYDVASGWDDCDYYSAGYVKDDIVKEIKKRLDK